jgi:hypothetical protein
VRPVDHTLDCAMAGLCNSPFCSTDALVPVGMPAKSSANLVDAKQAGRDTKAVSRSALQGKGHPDCEGEKQEGKYLFQFCDGEGVGGSCTEGRSKDAAQRDAAQCRQG